MANFEDFPPFFCLTADILPEGGGQIQVKYSPVPYFLKLFLTILFCRSRDEVQEVRQSRDPITGFRDKIVGAGLVTQQEVKKIEQTVRKDVDNEVKKAKEDGEIGVEELFYDMYHTNLHGSIRGISPWDLHDHKNTQVPVNQ